MSIRKQHKKLLFLGSIYSIGNVAQNILTIILLPLYTSYLYPKDFGIVALLTVTVTLIAKLVSPVNQAFRRYYYKPDYIEKNDVLLFNILLLLIIQALILTSVYYGMSNFLCNTLIGEREFLPIVKIFSIILFLECFSTILLDYLMLKEMARYYVFVSLTKLVVSSFVIVWSLVKLRIGVYALAYGQLFGLLFLSLMVIPLIMRDIRFKISYKILKEPLAYGYPQIVASYSNWLIQSGDRYVLRIFEAVETVGLYSFGYRIGNLIKMVLAEPLKDALWPIVLKKEDDPDQQKEFLKRSATYFYLAGIFAVLGLSLFSKEAIMLLARKKEYWGSWIIVPVIGFSYIQHGLGYFFDWGIIMKNKSYHRSGNLLAAAAVNIGLNFLFIPIWGMMGAAIATLISYIVWNILRLYFSNRFYGLVFQNGRIFHITAVGGVAYAASFLIPWHGILLQIIFKILLMALFPVLLYCSGFFSAGEKAALGKYRREMSDAGIAAFVVGKLKEIINNR
ncbi:MAG: polysaccharide biosynthesis protein [Elusimicrobia bacterium]|nr:polysaccharide biosynthesis protein [Elusimicrobiota bacterium]